MKTSTDKGADVTTGNKAEPHTTAGSAGPKSDDNGSAANHEAAGKTSGSSSTASSGGGERAKPKTSHTASHGRHHK